MNKRMKKLLGKLGMVLTVTAISTTSLMAAEVQEAPYSKWAEVDIYDAQNYGILDATWVQDGMKGTIDSATFIGLQQLVQNKLAAIPGTKPKAEQTPFTSSEVITKQEVLNMLYATLQNNEYEQDLKLGLEGEDAIKYMTAELEVVQGDGKSLGLDSPCTEEQAVVMARRFIESVYDVCDADSTGVFWKVEKNGNTVYMLGAIHIGRASMYPMSDEIEDAYDEADELAVEINVLQPEPQEATNMRMYLDGTTIKDHISEEYYEKLTEVMKKYNLTPEAFGAFKDWQVAINLEYMQMQNTGSGQEVTSMNAAGIDSYYLTVANMESKPITELETYMLQLETMDNKGKELKEYELQRRIDTILEDKKASEEELNAYAQNMNDMVECINNGDADKLKDLLIPKQNAEANLEELTEDEEELQKQADAFNKAFIDDRDKGMAEKIEAMLNSAEGKTYFVTVGAAHYISDTGIIKYLKDKGYEVTQIK